MDQTPQEKMTIQETKEGIHTLKVLAQMDGHPEATHVLDCALLHLEGAQADKEIVDYLNSKEVRLQWIDNACQPQPGEFREVMKEMIAYSAMAAQTEGERP